MKFKRGGYYEGLWKEGRRDGLGEEKDHKGNIYKGQFKENHKEGRGRLELADKPGQLAQGMYDGLWSANKRNGKGVEHYSNGDVYEGQFAND